MTRGRLNVSTPISAKEAMFLRCLTPGTLVGWSLLAGEAHTADLIAATPLKLALIPGMAVRRLFRDDPAVALRVIAGMGSLLGQLSDEKAELRYRSLPERVLMAIERQAGPGERLETTQAELAPAAGATRSRGSEALAQLEADGLVIRGRGWVQLPPA